MGEDFWNTIIATIGSVSVGLGTALLAMRRAKKESQIEESNASYNYSLQLLREEREVLKEERADRDRLVQRISELRAHLYKTDEYIVDLQLKYARAMEEINELRSIVQQQARTIEHLQRVNKELKGTVSDIVESDE